MPADARAAPRVPAVPRRRFRLFKFPRGRPVRAFSSLSVMKRIPPLATTLFDWLRKGPVAACFSGRSAGGDRRRAQVVARRKLAGQPPGDVGLRPPPRGVPAPRDAPLWGIGHWPVTPRRKTGARPEAVARWPQARRARATDVAHGLDPSPHASPITDASARPARQRNAKTLPLARLTSGDAGDRLDGARVKVEKDL